MQVFGSLTSPYVRHVRIVILQTGSSAEFVEADAAQSALDSPTKKVPYLRDGDIVLSDSSSIIKYLREKSGQPFIPATKDYDLFCLINTLMDSAINLFLLERSGLNTCENGYLKRQATRVKEGIEYLSSLAPNILTHDDDVHLRLLCFLAWGQFRNRFSLDGHDKLQMLLDQGDKNVLFLQTRPPA